MKRFIAAVLASCAAAGCTLPQPGTISCEPDAGCFNGWSCLPNPCLPGQFSCYEDGSASACESSTGGPTSGGTAASASGTSSGSATNSSGTSGTTGGATSSGGAPSSGGTTSAGTTSAGTTSAGTTSAGTTSAGTTSSGTTSSGGTTGGASGLATLAVGYAYACISSAGTTGVYCWGNDASGQLGNGQATAQPTTSPAAATKVNAALRRVDQLALGSYTTCALSSGNVYCWGGDDNGECGFDAGVSGTSGGKENHVLSPDVPVEFRVGGILGNVTAIAAGEYFTCALDQKDDKVYCWGRNTSGQLGNGATEPSQNYAEAVAGLPAGLPMMGITAGSTFACAYDAGVYCWGDGTLGELGPTYVSGSSGGSTTPVQVPGLPTNIASVAAGGGHLCALTTTGSVACWGNNPYGQIGDGENSTNPHPTPVTLTGLPPSTQVAAGGNHSCAVTTTGALYCWGDNDAGQLGLGPGSPVMETTPTAVLGGGVAAVALGNATSCAEMLDGGILCWGANDAGEVGNGSNEAVEPAPVAVGPFP